MQEIRPDVGQPPAPRPGDKWYLDEVFIRIRGVQHDLWRAVDQDGVVLDILVQERHDSNAAKRFFRRSLKGLQYVPRVIVTDKLRSHGIARRHLLPGVEHRQSRYLDNRAENSHRPTPRRERTAKRDRKAALRFLYKATGQHGTPAKITIDKSGANTAAIESYNAAHDTEIEIRRVKYLNNVVEQDHRAIERQVRPMMGFSLSGRPP